MPKCHASDLHLSYPLADLNIFYDICSCGCDRASYVTIDKVAKRVCYSCAKDFCNTHNIDIEDNPKYDDETDLAKYDNKREEYLHDAIAKDPSGKIRNMYKGLNMM